MKEVLLNLIRERTNKVVLVVAMLREKFGDVNSAIINRFNDRVSKKGFLDAAQTVSYNFHGSGISVDFGDEEINFDFNFNAVNRGENHTGFDHWRLNEFLRGHQSEFAELSELSIEGIQTILKELERESRIDFDERKNLYYLPENLIERNKSKKQEIELALS